MLPGAPRFFTTNSNLPFRLIICLKSPIDIDPYDIGVDIYLALGKSPPLGRSIFWDIDKGPLRAQRNPRMAGRYDRVNRGYANDWEVG